MKEANQNYRMSETFDSVSSGSVLYMNDTLSDSESVQLMPSDISGFSDITRFSLPDTNTTLNETVDSLSSLNSTAPSKPESEFVTVKKMKNAKAIGQQLNPNYVERSCPLCNTSMKALNMYRHMRRTHGWNEEQIDIYKMQLRRKKYAGRKLFECSTCQAVYATAAILAEHKKKYGCTIDRALQNARQLASRENSQITDLNETSATSLKNSSLPLNCSKSSTRTVDLSRVDHVTECLQECSKLRNRLSSMEIGIVSASTTVDAESKLTKIVELYKMILKTNGNCELVEARNDDESLE